MKSYAQTLHTTRGGLFVISSGDDAGAKAAALSASGSILCNIYVHIYVNITAIIILIAVIWFEKDLIVGWLSQ